MTLAFQLFRGQIAHFLWHFEDLQRAPKILLQKNIMSFDVEVRGNFAATSVASGVQLNKFSENNSNNDETASPTR